MPSSCRPRPPASGPWWFRQPARMPPRKLMSAGCMALFPMSPWSQQVTLPSVPGSCGCRFRFCLLAGPIVNVKSVLPNLLGNSLVDPCRLEGRQYRLNQWQELRIVNGPSVLWRRNIASTWALPRATKSLFVLSSVMLNPLPSSSVTCHPAINQCLVFFLPLFSLSVKQDSPKLSYSLTNTSYSLPSSVRASCRWDCGSASLA